MSVVECSVHFRGCVLQFIDFPMRSQSLQELPAIRKGQSAPVATAQQEQIPQVYMATLKEALKL